MSSHEAGSSEGIRLLEGSKCVYQCKAKRKREIRRGGEAPLRAPEGREFPSPAADHHPEGREDESASCNARKIHLRSFVLPLIRQFKRA